MVNAAGRHRMNLSGKVSNFRDPLILGQQVCSHSAPVHFTRARLFHRAPCRALIPRAGKPHRIARRDTFLRTVDKPVRKGQSG
jgi:hypothetical protein